MNLEMLIKMLREEEEAAAAEAAQLRQVVREDGDRTSQRSVAVLRELVREEGQFGSVSCWPQDSSR